MPLVLAQRYITPRKGGGSVPWTIRCVERRVSPARRGGLENSAGDREDSLNRRRGGDRRADGTPGPASRIRVLVVEDNRVMRDGLARLLAPYPDVDIVASADKAGAATQQLREVKPPPQVVLLDAGLSDGDSHTFLADLKATEPDTKAIVIDFVPAQQDVDQF